VDSVFRSHTIVGGSARHMGNLRIEDARLLLVSLLLLYLFEALF
jgi:hypothetical protein